MEKKGSKELFKKKLTIHVSQEETDAESEFCKTAAGDRSSKDKDHDIEASYSAVRPERTKAWNYDMIGHAEQCVKRWCELAGREIK